jgi:Sec-independent protein secretion pathway component TatC
MAPSTKVVFRVVGAVVALAVALLVAATWWISSLHERVQADATHATKAFAEVRERFPGLEPAFEIRDAQLVVVRPAAAPSPAPPTAVHMLIWQPGEQLLSRVTLPLWISRVATEPVPLEALAGIANQGLGEMMNAKRRGNELNIRISDLESYGRTLLLDGVTPDGKQVMMWNE